MNVCVWYLKVAVVVVVVVVKSKCSIKSSVVEYVGKAKSNYLKKI